MIATNLIRDHWRKAERERRAMRSVTAGADRDAVTYPVEDADVRSLIQSLPARLRDPFLLHYYAGFPLQGGRGAAAPARGHDQGRPVRGARQAAHRAGRPRWLTGATTWIPGWTGGSSRCPRRRARSI